LSVNDSGEQEENHRTAVVAPDNKKRVHSYIKNNPGSHLRRISKELVIAIGDIQYQLKILEGIGLIKSRRMGLYKTYYPVSILGERSENILAVLQQETLRDILLHLIENPGATQSDIAHHKGFTAPTINWHMSRLIEMGLVYTCRERRFVKYYVEGDIDDIVSLLKSYHPSTWNTLSNRLASLFLDLSSQSRPEKDPVTVAKETNIEIEIENGKKEQAEKERAIERHHHSSMFEEI
jgi:DNA-binding MarR family transcriptional regulator